MAVEVGAMELGLTSSYLKRPCRLVVVHGRYLINTEPVLQQVCGLVYDSTITIPEAFSSVKAFSSALFFTVNYNNRVLQRYLLPSGPALSSR